MAQYFDLKSKYKEAILLFRVGDFYETFGEDAIKTAQTLGIVLTARNNGGSNIELAGFPHHSLELYLPKMVKAGYRIAICEQLEKPSKDKKIVKRGVTEIVSPGITISDSLLDQKTNNYLSAVHRADPNNIGLAFLDLSTGEFLIAQGPELYVDKLLQSFKPAELLASRLDTLTEEKYADEFYYYKLEEWIFQDKYAQDKLRGHFETENLKGFGIADMPAAIVAASACLHYLNSTEHHGLEHINKIQRILPDTFMWLDRFTITNLELLQSNNPGGTSLVDCMDHTLSPMGGRLMKRWIVMPLKNKLDILRRQNIVEAFLNQSELTDLIAGQLKIMGDLERLISKLALSKINPREVNHLSKAMQALVPIKEALTQLQIPELQSIAERINPCLHLIDLIDKTIHEEAPVNLTKGQVIRSGADEDLDRYISEIQAAKQVLLDIQVRESEQTGITTLKVGFNNVFGYYLAVSNRFKNQGLVPEHWVRKQTLTNAERYITDELKIVEEQIISAQEKITQLELEIYERLLNELKEYVQPIQLNAGIMAELDCLRSFAFSAEKFEYVKPDIDESYVIDIKAGRHPVIEQQLRADDPYVANDLYMDLESQQILMITGPNMSGKSALLRQTALISLLAQCGSFVPASKARLGILDKIFTRVGASDNISSGESTFMVEMSETASIMNNISDRSLILLDEIGRGTSTYDGISIAWALTEYIHENGNCRPRTLFATHYHELNDLANTYPRIKNFHVSTQEYEDKVIFLRKLKKGGVKHSFGIHVAKMAGMPNQIVARANEILKSLELKNLSKDSSKSIEDFAQVQQVQLNMFEQSDYSKIAEEINNFDINSITPVEALLFLKRLQEMTK